MKEERGGSSVEYGFIMGVSGLSLFYSYLAKKVEEIINEMTRMFFYIYPGPP
ncbi:MAG: hypothetical protein ABDH37_05650 [Candidatus Hydrothermales bacterium]